jgi:transposase-like protein
LRARIVLACAEGATNKAVAERLGVWPQTVTKWRGRFVRGRLEGLSDEPRPGRPRTITTWVRNQSSRLRTLPYASDLRINLLGGCEEQQDQGSCWPGWPRTPASTAPTTTR